MNKPDDVAKVEDYGEVWGSPMASPSGLPTGHDASTFLSRFPRGCKDEERE